jgi:hypothetical protein
MEVNPKDLTYPEIICPDCSGECFYEVITYLSYDGWMRTKMQPCETCDGNGWIYDPDFEEEEVAQ